MLHGGLIGLITLILGNFIIALIEPIEKSFYRNFHCDAIFS